MTTDEGSEALHGGNGTSAEGARRTVDRSAECPPEDEGLFAAAARAGVQALELGDHVATLLQVRADRARLAVRRSLTRALVLVLALLGLAALVAAGAVWLAAGVVGGMTAAFEGRAWLGQLSGGVACLAVAAGIVALALKLHDRRQLRERAAKYEERRRKHAEQFGPAKEEPVAPSQD